MRDTDSEVYLLRKQLKAERTEKKQLNSAFNKLSTIIESLHETTLGLMNRYRIDDLLETILKRAVLHAGTSDAYMYLLNEDKTTMEMKIGIGLYENERIYDLQKGKGFGGEIWRSGKPLTLDNYASWPNRFNDSRWDCLRAVIGVPLKSEDKVFGIIVLSTTDPQKKFTRDEILQLSRFAEIASLALENAHLYNALENELNEHRKTELELHQSMERLRALFNNAKDYIYIKNNKFVYTDINPAMVDVLGRKDDEIIGKSDNEIFDSATAQRLIKSDISVLQGEASEEEYEIDISGKQICLHNVKVPLRNKDGEIIGIFGIARDVTDRNYAEMQIQSAKEAVSRAERMASLGVMAAGISHEINQPLNSIKVTSTGITYLHKKGIIQEVEEIIEDVSNISKQADLIEDIVSNVRSFVLANKESKTIEPCHFSEAIVMSLSLMGSQLSAHGIRVKEKIELNVPMVYASKTSLVEVVINLLRNSMEALDTVYRDDKCIEIHLFSKNGIVYLHILDNGPGLSSDVIDNIFEPFYTTKKQGESMGLGLSILQSIIESYGGSIKVDRNVSCGAKFVIEIPPVENDRSEVIVL